MSSVGAAERAGPAGSGGGRAGVGPVSNENLRRQLPDVRGGLSLLGSSGRVGLRLFVPRGATWARIRRRRAQLRGSCCSLPAGAEQRLLVLVGSFVWKRILARAGVAFGLGSSGEPCCWEEY